MKKITFQQASLKRIYFTKKDVPDLCPRRARALLCVSHVRGRLLSGISHRITGKGSKLPQKHVQVPALSTDAPAAPRGVTGISSAPPLCFSYDTNMFVIKMHKRVACALPPEVRVAFTWSVQNWHRCSCDAVSARVGVFLIPR